MAACDAQLAAMAAEMGVRPPHAGTWCEQFQFVADQLQQALILCDVTVPGMKVHYANEACELLVGYPVAEMVGKNCRFLQGKGTEASAVREIVKAIRAADTVTVPLTNYRKDGMSFVNVLTLHPVKDSTGAYRYQIGLLSDQAQSAQEGPALDRLRKVLPTVFDASSQPKKFEESLTNVDEEAQMKQWMQSMAKFTRVAWSMDWETSLRQLMNQQVGQEAFGQWVKHNAPSELAKLQVLIGDTLLERMDPAQAGQAALRMSEKVLGKPAASPEEALEAVHSGALEAERILAADTFPKFVQSKAVGPCPFVSGAPLTPALCP